MSGSVFLGQGSGQGPLRPDTWSRIILAPRDPFPERYGALAYNEGRAGGSGISWVRSPVGELQGSAWQGRVSLFKDTREFAAAMPPMSVASAACSEEGLAWSLQIYVCAFE
jgi:hypothetical protein